MTAGYQRQGALDVEACEDAPIHFIGALQAPYAMAIWRPRDGASGGAILGITTNLPDLVGKRHQDLDGLPVRDLFRGSPDEIERALANGVEARPAQLCGGRDVLVRGCSIGSNRAVIIDPEPSTPGGGASFGSVLAFNALIEEQLANSAINPTELAAGLAAAFRTISGYDRVMVYEFDTDWNGQIIAEDVNALIEARYLGLTFPSSDIPRPARDLFLKNRVRPLIDIAGDPVGIHGFHGETAADFDIGALPERAVSPVHLAYLGNMGVRATLTIALKVQGRLWGLLTCHHYSGPRKLSGPDLAQCRVLCDLLSHAMNRARDRARLAQSSTIDALGRTLRAASQTDQTVEDFASFLQDHQEPILTQLQASGALITLGAGEFWVGAPPPSGLAALRVHLDARAAASGQAAFCTNHIAGHFPELAAALLPDCAGIARVGNSPRMSALTVWRPATPVQITWAGNPDKRMQPGGPLTPRGSFDRWQDLTADKSAPWKAEQGDTLSVMLTILSEVGWTLEKRRAERKAQSARDQAERAKVDLEHASLHDALTDLPNRRYLDMTLTHLAQHREDTETVAALQIDLDRFKVINDTLGHAAGDKVLVHVAEVLRRQRRATDFVARVGGDEFVLIARRDVSPGSLADLAQGIIDTLSQPIRIGEEQVSFAASIGIAIDDLSGLVPETFLSRADIALYEAKRTGRGRFCFVSDTMEQARIERRRLGEDVLRGFQAGEFALYYQLQVSAQTHKVSGAEALLRWNHPRLGLLTPNDFMEAAEDIGVIEKLDAFSVQSALDVQRGWAESGFVVPKIGVNVSARRLKEMNVARMVAQHPDMPGRIAFELLETIDLSSLDSVSKWNIESLKDAGIALEIDDFGTGHTSILSLVQMKPDRLKIDRNLVLPAIESEIARDVIRSIVSIAKTLGIGVTAEGIETMAHAALLRDLGCDTLQGFAFARPMAADDIRKHFVDRMIA